MGVPMVGVIQPMKIVQIPFENFILPNDKKRLMLILLRQQ